MLRAAMLISIAAIATVTSACESTKRDEPAATAPTEPPVTTPSAPSAAPSPESDELAKLQEPGVPAEAPPADQGAADQGAAPCSDGESCYAEASRLEREQKGAQAAPLYERACSQGAGAACHRLGELHEQGKHVTLDEDRAHALYSQGCQLGSTAACDALGH